LSEILNPKERDCCNNAMSAGTAVDNVFSVLWFASRPFIEQNVQSQSKSDHCREVEFRAPKVCEAVKLYRHCSQAALTPQV
jgi:hypothetical protein